MDRLTMAQATFRVMEIQGEGSKYRRTHGLIAARKAAARERAAQRRGIEAISPAPDGKRAVSRSAI